MLYKLFLENKKICTDSRKVEPGSIFFALKGDSFDGNSYALSALESGAAYAVVDDPTLSGDRLVLVNDVLEELQRLAAEHRKALAIPIIALTGSNGKTTTKEFMKRVLATKYKVGATVGNLNNHIGVPLTLLSFDENTEIGIVEMGANHQREIELLCKIASPDVGLITNVGLAHLEGFGGAEGVRRGKGELYDYLLKTDGTAIFNATDDALSGMVHERGGLKNIGYDPYAEPLELSIYGDYNQLNAQAAFAVGKFFGVDTTAAKEVIRSYVPENNRSQVVRTRYNTLYMDAYNANPSSMKIAIENFGSQKVDNKALILGEMRELGDYSEREHAAVVDLLVGKDFETVILVGKNFEKCKKNYMYFGDVKEFRDFLVNNKLADKHILIKGSRGVALEKVIDLL